jgi:2,3-diketo-5-methylthio-1-phosphopentane phosphatase
MAVPLPRTTRAVLLDIEGTTTSIAFVYDTLFPFARAQLAGFLERSWAEPAVQADVALVRAQALDDHAAGQAAAPLVPDDLSSGAREATLVNLLGQMDADRKTTGLKAIQGKVWVDGYISGDLLGHVYDDVPRNLEAWRGRGLRIAIYSSGSIAAQKLLFGHSIAGDLTPALEGYFDTTTGPKKEAASYAAIARKMNLEPGQVTFLTDSLDEARAADEAGVHAVLTLRPGNAPLPDHPFPTITSFDALVEAP